MSSSSNVVRDPSEAKAPVPQPSEPNAVPTRAFTKDLRDHPAYRADVDGLRALAIIPVLLFHAFPTVVPGGFVGVDIFFVISGFLISSIIFRGLQRERFSFAGFYANRIKRIFPALLLVLGVGAVFGWFFSAAGRVCKKQISGLTVLDPFPCLCDAAACYALRDGRLLYQDDNHLSAEGSAYLGEKFLGEQSLLSPWNRAVLSVFDSSAQHGDRRSRNLVEHICAAIYFRF